MTASGVWFVTTNAYTDANGTYHTAGVKLVDFAGNFSSLTQGQTIFPGTTALSRWNAASGDTLVALNGGALDPVTLSNRAYPLIGPATAISWCSHGPADCSRTSG